MAGKGQPLAAAGSGVKTRSLSTKDETDPFVELNKKIDGVFTEVRAFREESKSLGVSIEATHEKIDELKNVFEEHRVEFAEVKEDVSYLMCENNTLKKELLKVKEELNNVQQYTRSNCIDIQGVPEVKGENIVEVVRNVVKAVRYELKTELIDSVHRLAGGSNTDSRPRGIILKLTRRQDCLELLRLAKTKKGFSASELGFSSENRIFINPSLSKMNRELLYLARGSVRDGAMRYAWINNGRVFVRKVEGQPAVHIQSWEQLRQLTQPPQQPST